MTSSSPYISKAHNLGLFTWIQPQWQVIAWIVFQSCSDLSLTGRTNLWSANIPFSLTPRNSCIIKISWSSLTNKLLNWLRGVSCWIFTPCKILISLNFGLMPYIMDRTLCCKQLKLGQHFYWETVLAGTKLVLLSLSHCCVGNKHCIINCVIRSYEHELSVHHVM